MASLQTINCGVAKQQQIAVTVIGRGGSRVTVFLNGVISDVIGEIMHQSGRQNAQIPCGGGMTCLGQTFRIFVTGGFHAERFGLLIHQLHEAFDSSTNAFCQCHGGIISALYDHAFEKVFHRHHHLGINEHTRTRHLPCALTNRQGLLQINFFTAQGIKNQVCRHQLGEGCRLHRNINVLCSQHLIGRDVKQQIGTRSDFGRLRRLRGSRKTNGSRNGNKEILHGIKGCHTWQLKGEK